MAETTDKLKFHDKSIRQPGYEYLATAIIEQAIADYLQATRKVSMLKDRIEHIDELEVRKRRKGETKRHYHGYKRTKTKSYFDRKLYEQEQIVASCIEFFEGNWIKSISTLDGLILLDKCNEELAKEGYGDEVN